MSTLPPQFLAIAAALECSICLEDNADIRSLLCGHSICQGCIESLGDKWPCPCCRLSRKVPKGGYPKNYSLHAIIDGVKSMTHRCLTHKLFSLDLKCLTCFGTPIICTQCFVHDHLGHCVVAKDQPSTDVIPHFQPNFRNTLPAPVSCDSECQTAHPTEFLEKSIQTNTEPLIPAPVLTHASTNTTFLESQRIRPRRGDCALYMYTSRRDGERYLGVGLVRSILSHNDCDILFPQLYHSHNLTRTEPPSRKRKIQESFPSPLPGPGDVPPNMVRLTPYQISQSLDTSRNGRRQLTASNQFIIKPYPTRVEDIPFFSILSTSIILTAGGTILIFIHIYYTKLCSTYERP